MSGPRLDAIISSNRNIQFLLCVAIEVSDEKAPAAVWIVIPTLESAGNTCAELFARLGNLLTQQQSAADEGAGGAHHYRSLHY
jgi:hypothetical protein